MSASGRYRGEPSWRPAFVVIDAYAAALGVSVRRVRATRVTRLFGNPTLPRDFNPGNGWETWAADSRTTTAFRFPSAEVVWAGSVYGAVLSLPHEITHARWGPTEDAIEEWDVGMISFELAWLDRLIRDLGEGMSRKELDALGFWSGIWCRYAAVEGPADTRERAGFDATARRVVAERGLPDPWASSQAAA